jgi:protein-tyrosine phosphatase
MNQIKPHPLWVGHAGDCHSFREVFDAGIRAIVQVAMEEPPCQPPRELIFYRFPLVDGSGNDPDLLHLAIHSISILVKKGIPTLVGCGAGMSRSPAIAAAALALANQVPLGESVKCVSEYRPIDISPGFLAQVVQAVNNERG